MIEVGEYIRTKKGYIAKVTEIDNFIWFNEKINKESGMAVYELSRVEFKNLVTKHSKNIIDLIEMGDYVNGHKVYRIDNTNAISIETETNLYGIIYAEDIKTILTHELYEEDCYKVGDIE